MSLIQFLKSDRFDRILNWSFSVVCLTIAILQVALTIGVEYQGVSGVIVFTISAIMFCPLVKAPVWIKLILGVFLVIGT